MSLYVNIEKKLKDFYLKIEIDTKGSHLGILGQSGCGKSMTLRCIAGIERPDKGKIVLNDRVLFDSKEHINLPPQKRNVGILFQNYGLFPHMTVFQNVEMGLKDRKKGKDEKTVSSMLKRFHMEEFQSRYPHELSGGQQQRVALARIMAYEPEVILLDEPFSALDMNLKETLQLQMMKMLTEFEKDVILVSHSREEIYGFSEKLVIMKDGKVIMNGETKEMFADPRYVDGARMTGCKNISRIRRLEPNRLYAIDWNMELETKEKINDDISHIGVRAYTIKPSYKETDKNRFQCDIRKVVEGPFENNMMIYRGEDRHCIWWKVRKNINESFVNPEYIQIDPEDILLLATIHEE